MTIELALLVVVAYLVGSIPTAYLVGRGFRGIDLRRYGSGTVSGSMVYEHVSHWAVVPVGIVDVGKAALLTWVALSLDYRVSIAVAVGLATVIGHNWPLFLRFTGGRGLGCIIGVLLVVFPWGFAWMLAFLAIGWLLGDLAPWALASLITLPLLAYIVDGSTLPPWAVGAMLVLALGKRLEANRRPLPEFGPERRRVILRRLFLDRDIVSHPEWVRRRPDQASEA